MHPFAIFPTLLSFQILAPFLLRICAGLFVVYLGYKLYKKSYNFAAGIYAICGALVVLGLYTQIVAIISIAMVKFDFYLDYWIERKLKPISYETWILYTVFIIIFLSLIVTGPGFLAFDLPL